MTTYGAIPASSSPLQSPSLDYISRARDRIKSDIAQCRPWRQVLDHRALSVPPGYYDALSRLRANLSYFRTNYAIVILLVVFLSLLWHPISLIVLVVTMAAWLYLYFLRDEPLAAFGRAVDDRVVLGVLSVLTLVFLFLTDATVNILVALLVAAAVVAVHGAFRRTDDVDEEEGGGQTRGLMTTVGSSPS
ncbi:hypothetical protein MLD38_004836 [Melastoma candidum]|uniref:Uncharacterized protein n=1 Tax=Melastoma candidum TaxID=119954 RepID=A0ACB9S7E0_9MYRT|nr:hypothetical protein MLD38_004836 [Melastoma candidum]